jgi:hypothetical protein
MITFLRFLPIFGGKKWRSSQKSNVFAKKNWKQLQQKPAIFSPFFSAKIFSK